MNLKFTHMQEKDLDLVLEWRQRPHITKYMLTQFSGTLESQQKWFRETACQPDRKYWMITVDDVQIGVLNLIDRTYPDADIADAGFYVGEPKHANLAGFILPPFYNYIFDDCGFRTIQGHVVDGNPVLQLHLFHGYVGTDKKTVTAVDGTEVLCHSVELTRENWQKNKRLRRQVAQFD